MVNTYYNLHNHTMYSNTRFTDAINSVKGLIMNAKTKGLAGISISEHQSLASHPVAQKDIQALKQQDPHYFDHFKVTYGDEIYLCNRDEITAGRKRNAAYHQHHCQGAYTYTHFYHFVLTARNSNGYQLLEQINQQAWKDSFMFGRFQMQRRLPTYKDWLTKLMAGHQGDLIASTACLGSELSRDIMNLDHDQQALSDNSENTQAHTLLKKLGAADKDLDVKKLDDIVDQQIKTSKSKKVDQDHKKIKQFLDYLTKTFGKENVYFELMPSLKKQQKTVNKYLWEIAQKTGFKTIISTDSHFTDANNEILHESFLHAEQARRDVYDFYHYAHLFSYPELEKKNDNPHFKFFSEKVLQTSAQNSLDLLKTLQPINLAEIQPTLIQKKNTMDAKRVNRQIGHKMVTNLKNLISTIKGHWYGMN